VIVVVADTSPLNYLIQIDCDRILHALYDRVFVPTAVVEELGHPRAVSVVRAWLTQLPTWLAVEDVVEEPDAQLAKLDPGERQAIQLAKREHADLLLMDERLGVRIAREQGLAVTGTLEAQKSPHGKRSGAVYVCAAHRRKGSAACPNHLAISIADADARVLATLPQTEDERLDLTRQVAKPPRRSTTSPRQSRPFE
jgi:predicted nucleic acid-binding protein